MKPIQLKIAGLNSFREMQVIDFEALCQGGVFGIFGPTGSGKSSILDAMTLALFGSVERAAHNTQGILNLAQDSLSVQFSFSLGFGAQCRIYRAERCYKRASDNTVRAGICRLIESKDGLETVLAGSSDEVTRQIKEILGLNLDDFTRAVVLPQGKFSEFMSLAPGDRRNMLERLFGLEEYGKNLTVRVKQRLESTNQALDGIEKYQLGLGDASVKKVQEAEVAFSQTCADTAAQEVKLQSLKKAYEEIKEIWGLQESLAINLQKEQMLIAREPVISDLSQRLEQAMRAEKLRTLLTDMIQVEEDARYSGIQMKKAEESLMEAQGKSESAENQWRHAAQVREENETNLNRRLEQLDQAVTMENEIQEKKKNYLELQQLHRAKQQEKESLEQRLASINQQRGNVKQCLIKDKSRWQEIMISPEQRNMISTAVQAMEGYEKTGVQIEKAEKEHKDSERRAYELQTELTARQGSSAQAMEELKKQKEYYVELRQNNPVDEAQLLTEIREFERCKNLVETIGRETKAIIEVRAEISRLVQNSADVQANVANLKEQASKAGEILVLTRHEVESGRQRIRELETVNLASVLAEQLVEGNPCPVCGSPHHSSPETGSEEVGLNGVKEYFRVKEQELKAQDEHLQALMTQLAVKITHRDNIQDNLDKQNEILQEKGNLLAQLRNSLREDLRVLEIEQISIAYDKWAFAIELNKAKESAWKTEVEKLSKHIEELQTQVIQMTAHESELQVLTEAMKSETKQKYHYLVGFYQERETTRAQLDQARRDITVEDIPVIAKQYSAWDQEAQQINERLALAEPKLQALETDLEKMLDQKNQSDLELKEITALLVETNKGISEWERKLRLITGGTNAGELIHFTNTQLQQILAEELRTKQVFEQNRNVMALAGQELAVRQKEYEMLVERGEQNQIRLRAGMEEEGFLTIAMVENTLLDAGERKKMADEILQYQKEQGVLKEQILDLTIKIRGRKVEAADWLVWPERLQTEEETFKELLTRQAANETTLLMLKEKQSEWNRLEEEKLQIAHQADLLNSLQKVLQGNAFVEYIAQEQLCNVALDASERLGKLTNRKYALEIDSNGGFIIRDDGNGGSRRPVYSFSGGEKFLASLALALALSTQIQLHGEAPLEFFFLDEGFGTLDRDALEAVMITLEKLRLQELTIGIISHVEEIKSRMPRRLIVTPAESGGAGSQVRLELA